MELGKGTGQSDLSPPSPEAAKPMAFRVWMLPEVHMVAGQPQPFAWKGEPWLPALLLVCLDDSGGPM